MVGSGFFIEINSNSNFDNFLLGVFKIYIEYMVIFKWLVDILICFFDLCFKVIFKWFVMYVNVVGRIDENFVRG